MRISNNFGISNTRNIQTKKVNKKEIKISNNKETFFENFVCQNPLVTFGKNKKNPHYNARLKELKEKNIETTFATRLANLPDEQYKRATELFEKEIRIDCIEEISQLKPENYEQALVLIERGIFDSHLGPIASLDKKSYQKAIDLMDKGIDSDCIILYSNLNEEEFKEAENLLREGYAPIIAGHFSKLTPEQRNIAQMFLDANADVEIASQISKYDDKLREKCTQLLNQGYNPEFITEIAELEDEQMARLPELKKLKVSDSNIADFASESKNGYKKVVDMLKKGVFEDYITYILEIESGKEKNKEYKEYRSKNYSQTTAYSLSLLTEEELKSLEQLKEKNPIIESLFSDEYEVAIVDIQNDDVFEAILTKQMRTDNGVKITLVRTFDEYGIETKSRTEEYEDNSTSSIMSSRSGTFRAKYNKNGEIKELTEFVQDPKTGAVGGVFHSKASDILTSAYECTYYDINEFKEGGDCNNVDMPIENAVLSEGTPVSRVHKNPDGSVTYSEFIELNDTQSERIYTEKRDKSGKLIFSSYNYTIKKENEDTPLMDISRTFEKDKDGNNINTINGITYKTIFDDENKRITITDDKNTKIIEAKDKLPYYSAEVLWKEIKNLHTDTILNIFGNIKQWNYCLDEDSFFSPSTNCISTGKNNSIIYHEAGHIIENNNPHIFEDDDFVQKYGTEMEAFQLSIPYNEQEFVQYFSPRAELSGADGGDELVAESNILFTTYGTGTNKIKTRTQFLAKYFPETIAKIAELTGKNSRESLLK